jgi:hypothetical protein
MVRQERCLILTLSTIQQASHQKSKTFPVAWAQTPSLRHSLLLEGPKDKKNPGVLCARMMARLIDQQGYRPCGQA